MSSNRAFASEQAIADRLEAAGMGPAEARRKGRSFMQALAGLRELGASAACNPYLLYVPGRIEMLGKHTDYAGGRSLLATAERGFSIVAAARDDTTARIVDATDGSRVSFALQPELAPEAGHWSNYPMTVARRIARNFSGPLRGADIAFVSDLPPAAGMSSSSAMITAMFAVLAHVNGLTQRAEYAANIGGPEALAGYLATIENGQTFGSGLVGSGDIFLCRPIGIETPSSGFTRPGIQPIRLRLPRETNQAREYPR